MKKIISEGNISSIVYHRTSLNALYRILKTNEILLSSSVATSSDSYGGKPYFLSFSRTKNPKLGYNKNFEVSIEFDGNALKTKYKGGSYSYWQWGSTIPPRDRADSDEYEDRIFSNSPYLTDLDRYIKHIDIVPKSNIDRFKRFSNSVYDLQNPLINKIRVFPTHKDFLLNKNWSPITRYDIESNNNDDEYQDKLYFGTLRSILILIFLDDPNIGDISHLKSRFLEYSKYYEDYDIDIDAEVYKIKNYILSNKKYLDIDTSFVRGLSADIHNVVKSSTKTKKAYEVIKLLSDEMVKYKAKNITELIKYKLGIETPPNKNKDYSETIKIVYKSDNRYYIDDRENILYWNNLPDQDKKNIYNIDYEMKQKSIINYLFNKYEYNKAKELLSKSIPDEYGYFVADISNKIIYNDIYSENYSDGYDIGESSAWYQMESNDWYYFLKRNLGEKQFNQIEPKILKIISDEAIKVRFIIGITKKILGEKKTEEFMASQSLYNKRDNNIKQYVLSINK